MRKSSRAEKNLRCCNTKTHNSLSHNGGVSGFACESLVEILLPQAASLAAAVVVFTGIAAWAAQPERIVIDTDCGIFGDDGAAITMLARNPDRVRMEGISVVSGNVWGGAAFGYVRNILSLLGRSDVPLGANAGPPLIHSAAMADEEARRWGALEFRGAFAAPPPAPADLGVPDSAEFLVSAVQHNPGLTVFAIGPMTNLAIALRTHPEIASKIGRLVFMGGSYKSPGNVTKTAEFNFWFDPEAAQIVLRSRIPEKLMFGLDISAHAKIDKPHFDQIASADTPIARLYRDDAGNRYPGFLHDPRATGYLWDELTAAWLVDRSVVTRSEDHYLDVVTEFGPRYGSVIDLDRRLAPDATPVRVMLGLDFDRAFQIYRAALIARH
jgi:inosine-uridine nucleoside N-ribohydrolase